MFNRRPFIILIVLTLILLSACVQSPVDVSLNETPLKGIINLTNSSPEALPEEAEEVLISFFTSYYESLAKLEKEDLTVLFDLNDPESIENSYINQGTLDYLINHRKMQLNDLKIKSYVIDINIDSINKTTKNAILISLKEHRKINFSFIPDTNSYTSSIQLDFNLHSTQNGWKIQTCNRSEDINYLLNDLYLEAKEEDFSNKNPEEIINEIIAKLLIQSKKNTNEILIAKETYLSQHNNELEKIYDMKYDNDYIRLNAVAYANRWVSPNSIVRNPDFYTYDNYGGNCANYTSQSLFAGGIPMDYYGKPEAQWKWYGDYIIGREIPQGRAPAWTGVNEFYNYSLINSGFGLVSILDDNYFNGEIGDLIIFGTDLKWKHAVIITEVVRDEEGRVIDYLINSNTTDRINYPVSAYSYSKIQLIKILGWND